jgi:hypothetical protein
LRIASTVGISTPMWSGTLYFSNARSTRFRYGDTTLWAMNVSKPRSRIDTDLREAKRWRGETTNARWSV